MKIYLLAVSFLAGSICLSSCRYGGDAKSGGTDPNSSYAFLKSADFQPSAVDGLAGATSLSIGLFSPGDAYPDIVVHTSSSGMAYYANTEGEGFSAGVRLTASFQNHSTSAVYSSSIIGTADEGTGTLRILSQSNGTFTQIAGYDLPGSPVVSMAMAGNFIFAMTNPGTSYFSQFLSSDFAAATPAPEFNAVNGRARSIDLNADGFAEITAFGFAAGVIPRIYRGSISAMPALVAGTPITRVATSNITDFAFGFLSSTSKPDIIVLSDSGVEFYANQSDAGNFSFVQDTGISISATGSRILSADFLNQDSKTDLFIAKSGDAAKIFKQASSGTAFDDVTSQAFESGALGSGPVEIYAVDLNGDSYVDIVELYSDASVRVYINNRKTL